MNFLALAFPEKEAQEFRDFMAQENPSVKVTEFPHSFKEEWVNFNMVYDTLFEIYGLGYDFRGWQMEQVFSQVEEVKK